MTNSRDTAIVVGGGIGGLAAAVALAQAGWPVKVLEQARELREVGAGLQISPNGMRALSHLGLDGALEEVLFEPEFIALRMGRSGRRVFQIEMKQTARARWGERFIQIHRADLHKALQDRLRSLAGDVIHTATPVTGYVRERGGASVYIDGAERMFGKLVVAADGVHSPLRSQMHGNDRARFTGHVAWRCTVPVSELSDVEIPNGTTVWAGDGKHALTTRIRGGEMINFVAIFEQDDWTEEGWSIPGDRFEILHRFEGWDPFLKAVIEAAPGFNRWALLSRPALSTWRDGPVTLLGDAAHPMLPSMAQGAVQALEDAVVLGRHATPEVSGTALEEALSAYEVARKPRSTQVQKRSAQNLALFHRKGWMSKLAFFGPLAVAGMLTPALIHRQQDWIYGFDPGA